MAESDSKATPTLYNMMEKRFDEIRNVPFTFFPKHMKSTTSGESMNTVNSPSESMKIQDLYNLMEQRFDGIQRFVEIDLKSLLTKEIQTLEVKWDDRMTAIDQKIEILLQHAKSVSSLDVREPVRKSSNEESYFNSQGVKSPSAEMPNSQQNSQLNAQGTRIYPSHEQQVTELSRRNFPTMAIEATSHNTLISKPGLTSALAESTHRERFAQAGDHRKTASGSLENTAPGETTGETPPVIPAAAVATPGVGEASDDADSNSDGDSDRAAVHLRGIHFSRCGVSRVMARCPPPTSAPATQPLEPGPPPPPQPPRTLAQPTPAAARAAASAAQGSDSDDSSAEQGPAAAAAAAAAAAQRLRLSVVAGLATARGGQGGGGDLEEEARDAWAHLIGPRRCETP